MNKHSQRRSIQLSRECIAAASLELIDTNGLEAFSARRLAQALKCEAMSLYHHVADMGDALDLVVDLLLGSLDVESSHLNPREALSELSRAYLGLADQHPNAFPLVAGRRWRTPRAIAVAYAGTKLFQTLNLPPREASRRARVLGAYLNGAGLAIAAWRKTPDMHPVADANLLGKKTALSAEAVRTDLASGLTRLLEILVA
ncbi:MAG: TetR/AcrR family transcriptional regulator [Pseudomonadota bacterium]